MEEPKAEQVLKYIYDLYENPDLSAKEHASSWLNDFQKSVKLIFSIFNEIKMTLITMLVFTDILVGNIR